MIFKNRNESKATKKVQKPSRMSPGTKNKVTKHYFAISSIQNCATIITFVHQKIKKCEIFLVKIKVPSGVELEKKGKCKSENRWEHF